MFWLLIAQNKIPYSKFQSCLGLLTSRARWKCFVPVKISGGLKTCFTFSGSKIPRLQNVSLSDYSWFLQFPLNYISTFRKKNTNPWWVYQLIHLHAPLCLWHSDKIRISREEIFLVVFYYLLIIIHMGKKMSSYFVTFANPTQNIQGRAERGSRSLFSILFILIL